MIRSLRNSRRLLTIVFTLAREDALFIFEALGFSHPLMPVARLFVRKQPQRPPGARLATALEKLGPAFIKLGQVASTRSDLIGEDIAVALSRLRDNLPPFPAADARRAIETELGGPLEKHFLEFNDTPMAAASIAQVHRAVTRDGRKVAVKILRPNIEEAFARDLELLFWLAEITQYRLSGWRRLKPLEVVRTLKESVFFELDLRLEAAAAEELSANVKRHEPGLSVPDIDWQLTSRRVLTMQWVDGIPLSDVEAIKKSGFSPDDILAKASKSLFAQVFKDGFFHADLHPGNLFLDKNGDIVVVDFGIMGRLDWKSRLYMVEILRGFLSGDYRHVAEVHIAAGYVPSDKSVEAFAQACMAVAKPITGKPLNEISVATLLGQMFRIAAEFEMETQPQLLLLQKTMMVTEGVGRMLNPNLNMWNLSRPLIESWAEENLGAKAKLKEAALQGADAIKKFPAMLGTIENAIRTLGDPRGVRIHPDAAHAMQELRRRHHRQWFAFAWTALAIMLFSVLYLAR